MMRNPSIFVGLVLTTLPFSAYAQGGDNYLQSSIPSINTGININTLIGANRFYNAGYHGQRAVVTNIEAGHVWGGDPTNAAVGHDVLKAATVRIQSPLTLFNGTQLGQFDRHATWCGAAIAGRIPSINPNEYKRGIADAATLWSGAVATEWIGASPYRTSFQWSDDRAFSYPYVTTMQTGVQTANGVRRTDVVSSSWGDSSQKTGSDPYSLAIDGLVRANHTVALFAAGNSGSSSNTIGSPASGYNTICVGALGPGNNYSSVASFSSRGPQDYKGPDGTASKVRARVDIVAPGQSLTLAQYNGATGGNVGATNDLVTFRYGTNLAGTSFATPIVAGGASLLVDVGYDRFGGGNSIRGDVIKSVLLNSATKLSNWTNNLTSVGGILTTTQALDYASGAGALNLDRAFDQYTAGTHDISGGGGGVVETIGWDYGAVKQNALTDYYILRPLQAGTNFRATLNWFVGRTYVDTLAGLADSDPTTGVQATDDYFTNLDLQLWSAVSGAPTTLIAQSKTSYLNTEHFSFTIPTTGNYILRVAWAGERYDLVNHSLQDFGLSWAGVGVTAPEPGTVSFFLSLLGVALYRRSFRRRL